MIIPNIWENKKCSKAPTRICRFPTFLSIFGLLYINQTYLVIHRSDSLQQVSVLLSEIHPRMPLAASEHLKPTGGMRQLLSNRPNFGLKPPPKRSTFQKKKIDWKQPSTSIFQEGLMLNFFSFHPPPTVPSCNTGKAKTFPRRSSKATWKSSLPPGGTVRPIAAVIITCFFKRSNESKNHKKTRPATQILREPPKNQWFISNFPPFWTCKASYFSDSEASKQIIRMFACLLQWYGGFLQLGAPPNRWL